MLTLYLVGAVISAGITGAYWKDYDPKDVIHNLTMGTVGVLWPFLLVMFGTSWIAFQVRTYYDKKDKYYG
jgi:hypothetical protein